MTTPHLKKSIGSSSSRLALLIALVFACLGIRQSAQAGYIVTLQQVGPNVVAIGSGRINLTGLTFSYSGSLDPHLSPYSVLLPLHGSIGISTGPTSSSVDNYSVPFGPTSFGTGGLTAASDGSGDMVGIARIFWGSLLSVPTGYVSGTALSDMAIYTGKTFATLGVTPGTYVWTWGIGANQKFTLKILPEILPANGPPIVTTNPAAFIASFSATLKGSLNPDGLSTTFHFQYGTTTSYGLTTAPQTQTGDTSRPVSANINSLAAHTTYHFRIVASNTAGTTFGSDGTFTTLPPTGFPIVTTKPATNVATSSATLNGLVDPHGLTTSVYFQCGTTTNYGRTTAVQSQTGNAFRNIAANIGGLTGNTTYHFRIVATNSVGTRYGRDRNLYHAVAMSDNHESGLLRRSIDRLRCAPLLKQSHTPPRVNNLRRKWSTIPKAAAFHNQPSHFAVWRLVVSRRVTLTTHGSSGCRAPLKWNGGDYASTPSGQTAARKFLWSEKIPTLGRNLALVSVLYLGERPEMNFSRREATEGQNNKRN